MWRTCFNVLNMVEIQLCYHTFTFTYLSHVSCLPLVPDHVLLPMCITCVSFSARLLMVSTCGALPKCLNSP